MHAPALILAVAATLASAAQAELVMPPELLAAAFATLEAGEAAAAERRFREIVTDYPGETEAYRGLASAYVQQGRTRDALTMLVQVGSRMQQSGSAEMARPLLEYAVELDPEHTAARYFLGTVLSDLGQSASAAEQFRQALEAGDAQLATRVSLAAALWESGEVADAEAHYRIALERGGRNSIVLHQFATLLLFLGRDAEAAELLAEAVAAGPPGPYLLLDQARALAGGGQLDAAIEAAAAAAAAAPDLAQAHYQLGTLLVRADRREEAARSFEQVRRLTAAEAEAQRRMFLAQAAVDEARAALLAGRPEDTLGLLAGLPASVAVLELRAAAHTAAGDHGLAAGALEALLELAPGRRDVESWLVRERAAAR